MRGGPFCRAILPPSSRRVHSALKWGIVLHRFVLHNDQVIEASARGLAPGQVGLLSGWGVFTTFRIAEGVPFAFERHWARMQRDAQLFHVALPDDPEEVRRRLLE